MSGLCRRGAGWGSGLCFRETAEGEGPPWGQAALALDTKPTGQLLGGRGGKSLLLAVGHGPTRGQLPASVPLTTPWPRASARAQGPRSGPPGPAAALRVSGDHSLSAGRGDVSRGPIPLAHSPTERRTPGGPGGEVTALGGASGMPHWPRTERAPPGRTRPREAARQPRQPGRLRPSSPPTGPRAAGRPDDTEVGTGPGQEPPPASARREPPCASARRAVAGHVF